MDGKKLSEYCYYLPPLSLLEDNKLSKKRYFSGFRWSFWVLIYVLIGPSTWIKLICSKNLQIFVKNSPSNFLLILVRGIQKLSWFFLLLAHSRSVTVFGRNRPKNGWRFGKPNTVFELSAWRFVERSIFKKI